MDDLDINECVKDLKDVLKSITLKNSIKSTMINDLDYILRFTSSGIGVVSPTKAEEKAKELKDLAKVWISSESLKSSIEAIVDKITRDHFLLADKKEELKEEKINSSIVSPSLPPGTVSNRLSKLKPCDIRRLDVSYLYIGPVPHYCLIYKVIKDITLVIPMTTDTENFEGFEIKKSRFWKGKAIYSINQFPTSVVKKGFVMPYDHRLEGNQIIKECEKFLKEIFPKDRKRK